MTFKSVLQPAKSTVSGRIYPLSDGGQDAVFKKRNEKSETSEKRKTLSNRTHSLLFAAAGGKGPHEIDSPTPTFIMRLFVI